jgi:capsular exopolysaccharide synthesis family protein
MTNLPTPFDPSQTPLPARGNGGAMGFGAGGPPPPAAEDEGGGVELRRMLSAVLRYKWLVAVCSILGLLVGLAMTRVQRPTYLSQATIWLQPSDDPRDRSGPIQTGNLLQTGAWIDLLTSFQVLDAVVREQRLFLELAKAEDSTALLAFDLKPQFTPGTYRLTVDERGRGFVLAVKGGLEVQRGQVGDSVGPALGFIWAPGSDILKPRRVIDFTVNNPRDAAVRLANDLNARLPRDGNFMRLTLTSTIPSRAAGTLNSVMEHFVAVAATLKRDKLTQLSIILRQQLDSAYADLQRAERELQDFRIGTITEPRDPSVPVQTGSGVVARDPAFDDFLRRRVDRETLSRDRIRLDSILARRDSTVSVVELEGIASVQSASELKAALTELTNRRAELNVARTRSTDALPTTQRLIDQIQMLERTTIPRLIRELVTQIRSREDDLEGRISSASAELRNIPQRTITEGRLTRAVQIADALYRNLQSRYSEAQLAAASTVPDVRVLDRAVTPQNPMRNFSVMLLIGGMGGGFGLAIGIAILLDKFDRRVRYPDQVTRGMGLTILGTLPRLKSSPAGMRGDDAAQMVEALRTIRLNLVYAYGTAGPIVLTVTSPGSGDGKSFLASNLALTFADAGQKTLLIDGDIRRGALHRVLNVNRKPGLIDYLCGQSPRDAIIQPTRVANVDFLGCGTRKLGGPELLASQAMSQLLIALRGSYSVIILDCAPLGAGVDPLVLGSLTGNLLLVLRTGVTDREFAAAKMENIDRLPIRVLGAVLNDVRPEGLYRYYSYLPGYASEDEQEEPAVAGSSGQITAG